MPIILDKLGLSYTPVPKTACTSLKTMFFEIENGRKFTPFKRNGKDIHVHNVYMSALFNPALNARQADYRRLILVRDPILRLLSAYSNRVIHYKELSREKVGSSLAAHDIRPDPSLSEFITNLSKYSQAVESIHHHTRPLTDFAGMDEKFYSKVYRISEIEAMVDDISLTVGRSLKLDHLQTGGPKFTMDDLDRRDIEILREVYTNDYQVFGEYF